MLKALAEMRGMGIRANDGDIGRLDEFLFEDDSWTIRWLVIDTGGWLERKRVLISPVAFVGMDWEHGNIRLNMARERVEGSPDIDTDKPVSRQQEMDHFLYYGWSYYWGGTGLWGDGMYPGTLATGPAPVSDASHPGEYGSRETKGDPHLRSMREVAGYGIHALDGDIGHVEDFLLDVQEWRIRYLVADTRNWLPGRKVALPCGWVEDIRWTESRVHVRLQKEAIRHAPEIDPLLPLSEEEEKRLHEHFDRKVFSA